MSIYFHNASYDTYVPEKWFVAKRESNGLAYMVPYEKKSLHKSARRWARGRGRGGADFTEMEISADPAEGFEIVGTAKRSGRESNRELFRVKDPRGFVLEISPSNFFNLMQDVIVRRGHIQTPLAWARHGSDNILVPKGGKAYNSAVRSGRARRGDGLSIGDIELGWDVEIQRDLRGRFLGRWDMIEVETDKKNSGLSKSVRRMSANTNRRYAFLAEGWEVFVHSSPKPHIVHERDEIGYGEAARLANAYEIRTHGYNSRLIGLTRDRGENARFLTERVEDPKQLIADANVGGIVTGLYKGRRVVLGHSDGEFTIGQSGFYSQTVRFLDTVEEDRLWFGTEHFDYRTVTNRKEKIRRLRPSDLHAYDEFEQVLVEINTEGEMIRRPVDFYI